MHKAMREGTISFHYIDSLMSADKKIHEVWKVKANEGKRIASSIPYGYMRAPNEKTSGLLTRKLQQLSNASSIYACRELASAKLLQRLKKKISLIRRHISLNKVSIQEIR